MSGLRGCPVYMLERTQMTVSSSELLRSDVISASIQPLKLSYVHVYTCSCFLPARRYASAGYRDRNVSVRHAPVLCQNEES